MAAGIDVDEQAESGNRTDKAHKRDEDNVKGGEAGYHYSSENAPAEDHLERQEGRKGEICASGKEEASHALDVEQRREVFHDPAEPYDEGDVEPGDPVAG